MEIIGTMIVSVNKMTDITFSKDCPGLGSFCLSSLSQRCALDNSATVLPPYQAKMNRCRLYVRIFEKNYHMVEQSKLTSIHLLGFMLKDMAY